jgi:Holliday junction DNA helicase RuvB
VLGLQHSDRELLRTIAEKFNGGPVGLSTLAAALAEEDATIEEVYEPYLIRSGLLERTPRGRTVTPLGYEHIGKRVPDRPEQLEL